jgi:nucleotide-binding universal stress UspA family protein
MAAPFGNIVVPVDFSEFSAEALKYASAVHRCAGAKATALYANAFAPPPYFTESRLAEFERQYRESFQEARKALAEYVRATLGDAGAEFGSHVVEGSPADAVTAFAGTVGADLLVLGTHGRTGLNRLMLGSVAERVVRESRIPVLTVRRRAPGEAASIRRILCPVNDSAAAREALRIAGGLAGCLGARLTILQILKPGAQHVVRSICPPAAAAACEIEQIARAGDAAEEIVSASAETGCDLAVIGATHRVFFDATVLGTTTLRVIRHARCPVLTVPVPATGATAGG